MAKLLINSESISSLKYAKRQQSTGLGFHIFLSAAGYWAAFSFVSIFPGVVGLTLFLKNRIQSNPWEKDICSIFIFFFFFFFQMPAKESQHFIVFRLPKMACRLLVFDGLPIRAAWFYNLCWVVILSWGGTSCSWLESWHCRSRPGIAGAVMNGQLCSAAGHVTAACF